MGVELGREVGYEIRFDNMSHPTHTRIKYLTDGMLLRQMLVDPLLSQYSVVMLDEAHERGLNTDILLGLLKRVRRTRPDLRLIVASATLEADKFARFFDTRSEQEHVPVIPSFDATGDAVDDVGGLELPDADDAIVDGAADDAPVPAAAGTGIAAAAPRTVDVRVLSSQLLPRVQEDVLHPPSVRSTDSHGHGADRADGGASGQAASEHGADGGWAQGRGGDKDDGVDRQPSRRGHSRSRSRSTDRKHRHRHRDRDRDRDRDRERDRSRDRRKRSKRDRDDDDVSSQDTSRSRCRRHKHRHHHRHRSLRSRSRRGSRSRSPSNGSRPDGMARGKDQAVADQPSSVVQATHSGLPPPATEPAMPGGPDRPQAHQGPVAAAPLAAGSASTAVHATAPSAAALASSAVPVVATEAKPSVARRSRWGDAPTPAPVPAPPTAPAPGAAAGGASVAGGSAVPTAAVGHAGMSVDGINPPSAKLQSSCVIAVQGRCYPVEVQYSESPVADYVSAAAEAVLQIHAREGEGDILVFMPGAQHIDNCCSFIRDGLQELHVERSQAHGKQQQQQRSRGSGRHDDDEDATDTDVPPLDVFPLHANLPHDQQLAALEPGRVDREGRAIRKVIVATNIAETSLTIEGIVYVVDCGWIKVPFADPGTGISALLTVPVSRAGAAQRAGRAGRVRRGKCYRLYTEEQYRALPARSPPEVLRAELAPLLLSMAGLGVANFAKFDWLDPPRPEAVVRALDQLHSLRTVDEHGVLQSPWGQALSDLPVHPRLGACLLAAASNGCADAVLTIVAMSEVSHSLAAHASAKRGQAAAVHDATLQSLAAREGDHLTLLNMFNAYLNGGVAGLNGPGPHGRGGHGQGGTSAHGGGQTPHQWAVSHGLNASALARAVEIRGQLRKALLALCIRAREARLAAGLPPNDDDGDDGNDEDGAAAGSSSAHDPDSVTRLLSKRLPSWSISDDGRCDPSIDTKAEHIRKALTAGLFVNAARLGNDGSYITLRDGHRASLAPNSVFSRLGIPSPDWVVYDEAEWSNGELQLRLVTAINPLWLLEVAPQAFDTGGVSLDGKHDYLKDVTVSGAMAGARVAGPGQPGTGARAGGQAGTGLRTNVPLGQRGASAAGVPSNGPVGPTSSLGAGSSGAGSGLGATGTGLSAPGRIVYKSAAERRREAEEAAAAAAAQARGQAQAHAAGTSSEPVHEQRAASSQPGGFGLGLGARGAGMGAGMGMGIAAMMGAMFEQQETANQAQFQAEARHQANVQANAAILAQRQAALARGQGRQGGGGGGHHGASAGGDDGDGPGMGPGRHGHGASGGRGGVPFGGPGQTSRGGGRTGPGAGRGAGGGAGTGAGGFRPSGMDDGDDYY